MLSGIAPSAVAYMAIDINRRLLGKYSFVNVLQTVTLLNQQLPARIMNEVRHSSGPCGSTESICFQLLLTTVYKVILHLSAWTYSSEPMGLAGLDDLVNRMLRSRVGSAYQNVMVALAQVSSV